MIHTHTGSSGMVRAGIIGGAGYTGGEMISLLLHHPQAELVFVHSGSQAGKYLYEIHGDVAGETGMRFTNEWQTDIDVLFLCVGHGEARKFLEANDIAAGIRIVDLSQDFRLAANRQLVTGHSNATDRAFVYGLPELNREAVRTAANIANPGCFATAIQLGLLPLAQAGILQDVYTTGITGSTGAGQSLSATSHFSWRANNITAYKTLQHQHLAEIQESLVQVSGEKPGKGRLHFVPWRGDFTRGIFVSSTTVFEQGLEAAYILYERYYKDHPFTIVSRKPVDLKQAVNTNKCLLQLEYANGQLVIHTAIDNLLKGAAGQAVQNMNLLFGLEETAGLKLKGTRF